MIYVQKTGTLTAKDIEMSNSLTGSSCGMSYITNSGTATIENLIIDHNDTPNNLSHTVAGIINDGQGQMTLKNADIDLGRKTNYGIYMLGGKLALSDSAINTTGTTNYGAYIKDGELTLQNSTISATGTTSYGAYISNGDLVMGEPEPVDSPNYGTENANVSTTSPSIKAIGTTSGIGVYKDLGKFKFYDGIITASTSAIPRDNITTDVEHLYEPTFHTDAYGNDVCILTWMRDLPSQPGN